MQQQCEKYWHNQHGRYAGIDVWLHDSDILADFIVRTFHVSVAASDVSTATAAAGDAADDTMTSSAPARRVVKQFQFNGWSEHDVPSETAVLEFCRKIRHYAQDQPGPLLVHCRCAYM